MIVTVSLPKKLYIDYIADLNIDVSLSDEIQGDYHFKGYIVSDNIAINQSPSFILGKVSESSTTIQIKDFIKTIDLIGISKLDWYFELINPDNGVVVSKYQMPFNIPIATKFKKISWTDKSEITIIKYQLPYNRSLPDSLSTKLKIGDKFSYRVNSNRILKEKENLNCFETKYYLDYDDLKENEHQFSIASNEITEIIWYKYKETPTEGFIRLGCDTNPTGQYFATLEGINQKIDNDYIKDFTFYLVDVHEDLEQNDFDGKVLTINYIKEQKENYYNIYFVDDISSKEFTGTFCFYMKPKTGSLLSPISSNYFDLINREEHYKESSSNNLIIDNCGYFSTVGIWKYTSKPLVEIINVSKDKINANQQTFTGRYYNQDQLEKIYSYCFNVYDKNNNLYISSGEKIHNHEEDVSAVESIDSYTLSKGLKENEIYTLEYCITTVNGYKESSEKIRISSSDFVQPEIRADLIATYDRENAAVLLNIIGHKNKNKEIKASGMYVIVRSSSANDFLDWNIVAKMRFYEEKPSQYTWKDCTVENGVTYRYALQQYNRKKNFYSGKKYANEDIEVYFDDCFLTDGKRQLKVEYNPKISSFKANVLEQKTNTIGSKYPFIFRNGNVNYKEFPISGLISYLSDKDNYFISDKELGLFNYNLKRESTKAEKTSLYTEANIDPIYGNFLELADIDQLISKEKIRTTNLVDYNIKAEQIFKTSVLDFLNNGEPKLFRSPQEGNYIVRLLNSSLAPNDTLGRMLHTFSTTANEVAEFNFNNLKKYSIIHLDDWNDEEKIIKEEEIDLKNINNTRYQSEIFSSGIIRLEFIDIKTKIELVLKDDIIIIELGDSIIDLNKNTQFLLKSFYEKEYLTGKVKIVFYASGKNNFDSYDRIELEDIPCGIIKGPCDIMNYKYLNSKIIQENNKQSFYETTDFYYLKFMSNLETKKGSEKDMLSYAQAYNAEPYCIRLAARQDAGKFYTKSNFVNNGMQQVNGPCSVDKSYYLFDSNKNIYYPIIYDKTNGNINYKPSFKININNKYITVPENQDYEIKNQLKINKLEIPDKTSLAFAAIRKKVYLNED